MDAVSKSAAFGVAYAAERRLRGLLGVVPSLPLAQGIAGRLSHFELLMGRVLIEVGVQVDVVSRQTDATLRRC